MTYGELIHRLITNGIEGARVDYHGDEPRHRAKLAGAIDGFEACRDKTPAQIGELLQNAARDTHMAHVRVLENEISDDDYWRVRCREAEIDWMANCVSAMLVNQGQQPIVIPTARAVLAVAKIVGVKDI